MDIKHTPECLRDQDVRRAFEDAEPDRCRTCDGLGGGAGADGPTSCAVCGGQRTIQSGTYVPPAECFCHLLAENNEEAAQ